MNSLNWRKSSHSTATGNDCVELADEHGRIGIRDSKNPEGAALNVTRRQFGGLVSRIREHLS